MRSIGIISPRIIVSRKIVFPVVENQVQPNGIDLTIKRLFKIVGNSGGVYCDKTVLPENVEIFFDRQRYSNKNIYEIEPLVCYGVEFNESIKIPFNMCADLKARSSVVRNSGFIKSGLYDSGFENTNIGAFLTTYVSFEIEQNARIAQIFFHWADAASQYTGQWSN